MKTTAGTPDEYVDQLTGWRKRLVSHLRTGVVRAGRGLDEEIKWGHLVYSSNGPVCLIRAEPTRVLFGFWRGKRLVQMAPGLKPGGKYEMATLTLGEGDTVPAATIARVVKEAVALNRRLGDPRDAAKG